MDAITAIFRPLKGMPCWGVDRGHGSILSFEFGCPRLVVREPRTSASASAEVQRRLARRIVKPVGEWNLFIFMCRWRATHSGERLADDECEHGQIEAAARAMDGQKLTAVTVAATERATTFAFDLGAELTTWPYEANEDEQWSLYLPDGRVLTYRADGLYSVESADVKPDQAIWRPLP